MKTTLKMSLIAVLAVTVAACASTAMQVSSLRDNSVSATDSAPVEKTYVGRKPGNQALIERTFSTQPPLISHTIEDYEIGPTENACLDCHISDEFKGKKMPMVAKSHLLVSTDANAEPKLNMLRYQCNSCHVPQVDAKPLVENNFKG
jgi:cytochrome c-type protein NapB